MLAGTFLPFSMNFDSMIIFNEKRAQKWKKEPTNKDNLQARKETAKLWQMMEGRKLRFHSSIQLKV